jgi:hypothetical protein
LEELSPFCGVRSDEVLDQAMKRFEVVHLARAGALFPLTIVLDIPAIEREAPHIKEMVARAEAEAMRDEGLAKCGAYAVFRKPPPGPPLRKEGEVKPFPHEESEARSSAHGAREARSSAHEEREAGPSPLLAKEGARGRSVSQKPERR